MTDPRRETTLEQLPIYKQVLLAALLLETPASLDFTVTWDEPTTSSSGVQIMGDVKVKGHRRLQFRVSLELLTKMEPSTANRNNTHAFSRQGELLGKRIARLLTGDGE